MAASLSTAALQVPLTLSIGGACQLQTKRKPTKTEILFLRDSHISDHPTPPASYQVCSEASPMGPPRCVTRTCLPTPAYKNKPGTAAARKLPIPVVIVLGATGTGKSKLAIHLAHHFSGEVINSTVMQVYRGLDVLTNKVTPKERELVPHHLIDVVGDPDADFTADDFRRAATATIADVAARWKLPIVAGGSNSFIQALVDDPAGEFRSKHEICFLWVDVDMDVLHSFVSDRVDEMVEGGLVEEVHALYRPGADYTVGVRRSIGVPELAKYLGDEIAAGKEALLALAIDEMKTNTCRLTCSQLEKIRQLAKMPGWDVHRLAATAALRAAGEEEKAAAWQSNVAGPATAIVARFLASGKQGNI